MLPMKVRVLGLKVALTVKLMQVRSLRPHGRAEGVTVRVRGGHSDIPPLLFLGRQDDLHVVDSLEIPTSDPQYLLDLARYRHWGRSVLIVDV